MSKTRLEAQAFRKILSGGERIPKARRKRTSRGLAVIEGLARRRIRCLENTAPSGLSHAEHIDIGNLFARKIAGDLLGEVLPRTSRFGHCGCNEVNQTEHFIVGALLHHQIKVANYK